MIITECPACEAQVWYGYESGDEPCGQGVFDRVLCEECKAPIYIERSSFDGRTLSEAEAVALGLKKMDAAPPRESGGA